METLRIDAQAPSPGGQDHDRYDDAGPNADPPGVSNAIPTMAISVMAKQSWIPGCNVSTLRHSYSSGSATACAGSAMLAGFFCGTGGGTKAMLMPTTVANPNAI